MTTTPTTGDFLLITERFAGPIPQNDPSWLYQYSFVIDSDGNPANNYQPSSVFPHDFWTGGDRIADIEGGKGTPFALAIYGEANNVRTTPPSGTFGYVYDNIIGVFMPLSEFAVPNPGYRVTAFQHDGAFGFGGHPWSGAVSPIVGQPLATPSAAAFTYQATVKRATKATPTTAKP
jgi:hypothetical protein